MRQEEGVKMSNRCEKMNDSGSSQYNIDIVFSYDLELLRATIKPPWYIYVVLFHKDLRSIYKGQKTSQHIG